MFVLLRIDGFFQGVTCFFKAAAGSAYFGLLNPIAAIADEHLIRCESAQRSEVGSRKVQLDISYFEATDVGRFAESATKLNPPGTSQSPSSVRK